MWKLKCEKVLLTEEDVGDGEGSDDTDEIGNQTAYNGMASVLNTHTAKINREHIESSIGSALQNTA